MQITEARLQTANLPAVFSFYSDTLEMNVSHHDHTEIEILLTDGKMILEKAAAGTHPSYHFAFGIPFNQVEEARDWLQERVSLLYFEEYKGYIAEFKHWNARSLYFLDPAGNIVEFIGRPHLDPGNGASFSAGMIKNISEIGLVFPGETFDNDVKALLAGHDFHYYPRQAPTDHFRAIGDDDGLLICVTSGRNWYPTSDMAAGIFPTSVTFRGKEKPTLLHF